MIYKPQIDGLRAISVLPVVFYHMGAEGFSGGYLGVDVFFVISGYLITGIVSDQLETGRFSILYFYERRARRILPALYLVLFVCLVYMLFFQAPFFARDMAQGIVGTVFFAQNILLLLEASDYFSISADLKPLLHTWSLGVEEQFYIFYPLMLGILYRLQTKFRIWILLVLVLLSLILFSGVLGGDHSTRFYLLPMRAWELGLGCIVWLLPKPRVDTCISSRFVNTITSICLTILISAYLLFSSEDFYAGAVIVSFCSALLLFYEGENTAVNKLLRARLLVAVGLLSYSLYLWHQPVIVIIRQNFISFDIGESLWAALLVVVLIFLLSIVTYYCVEIPFRKSGRISKNKFIVAFLSLSFPLIGFGVFGHSLLGYEKMKIAQLELAKQDYYISYFDEVSRNMATGWDVGFDTTSDSSILVVGDSMAKDFVSALRAVNVGAQLQGLDLSCFRKSSAGNEICHDGLALIRTAIEKDRQIVFASDFASENNLREVAVGMLQHTGNQNVKVLGSLRFFNASSFSYLYARYESNKEVDALFFDAIQNTDSQNRILKDVFGRNNYIDKLSIFCPVMQKCKLYNESLRPLFFDEMHLTVEGQFYFGEELISSGTIDGDNDDI